MATTKGKRNMARESLRGSVNEAYAKRMMAQRQERLQQIVDEFNAAYPVGARVILRRDNGEEVETTVTAQARILSGHSAVAWFEGVSGCYSVEGRVRPAQKESE